MSLICPEQDGNGTYYYVDGRIYKGGWTEGIQTGKGSMTFPDGDSYVGDWDNGNMNGWGAFYWNNGNSYQVRLNRRTLVIFLLCHKDKLIYVIFFLLFI